ncbi:hypothetical protein JFR19_00730 [Serratia ureilytica]|nr:hypothetical protein [Serratia ureilytica]
MSLHRPLLLATLFCSAALLSGCKNTSGSPSQPKPAATAEPDITPAQREAERLAQCQKELDALKGINAQQYTVFRQEFDRLMSGAAQYANLRVRVNNGTQETVDALYRYKVNRLCADIMQATLTGLADRGEKLK